MASITPSLWMGLLATVAALPAAARQRPFELERLSEPIEVDGTPDEPAWRDVAALSLTQYAPVFRGTPRQRTEIHVAYDDENLYAAGWFYDDDPGGIRINSLYRDRWNGDDAFAIYIDAFNDERNNERTLLVDVDDVDWIEAVGDYVRLHTAHGVLLLAHRMHALRQRLDPALFLRIHRSTIVNLARVRAVQRADDGGGLVHLESGVQLRVARNRWARFERAMLAG